MAISIKGINTGVIRKANEFIALALKIKEPRNKESLFFLSALELRDLLIAVESRLHQKQQLNAAERQHYEKRAIISVRKCRKTYLRWWKTNFDMPIFIVALPPSP